MVCGNRLPYAVKGVNKMSRVYVKEELCIGCHLCEVYWLLDMHTGLSFWCYKAGHKPKEDGEMRLV